MNKLLRLLPKTKYPTVSKHILITENDQLLLTCSVRRNAVRSRDPIQYCMETELMFQALPIHVQDQVTFHYL